MFKNEKIERAVNFIMWKMAERVRKGLPGPSREEFPDMADQLRDILSRDSLRSE